MELSIDSRSEKTGFNGSKRFRVVIDFRKLNQRTVKDGYPLPNISGILKQLGKSKLFTTLDLASGLHQILTAPADRAETPFEHYKFFRMPYGLKGAPSNFQDS